MLALFLWERRQSLQGKRILELGSGTSLPGILASKCGATVTLSDCGTLPKTLEHIKSCCDVNNIVVGKLRENVRNSDIISFKILYLCIYSRQRH